MRYRTVLLRAAIAFLAVLAAADASAGGTGATALSPVPSEHASPPTLVLNSLNGDQYTLADFAGKVLLVNFWATWCAPCIKELPSMQAARSRLAGEPFEVIAVNVGEDPAEVKNFLDRLDTALDYLILLDENMVTTKKWKVRVLPTTYIVDAQGQARYVAMGERDFGAAEIVSMIRALAQTQASASDG
ncbi:MAG: TlpA disulfide reductase family protein [Arenicellales bacterium]|nr:TlpA disulfide reductase family protein [Arenicellales bacterium]MDP6791739.1 TlpA disulfide reductase family protein [Arenicellales bacterium]